MNSGSIHFIIILVSWLISMQPDHERGASEGFLLQEFCGKSNTNWSMSDIIP